MLINLNARFPANSILLRYARNFEGQGGIVLTVLMLGLLILLFALCAALVLFSEDVITRGTAAEPD